MNVPRYNHVLFKDLEDYVKKTDYLGGYTEREKSYIRANLGIDSIQNKKVIYTSYDDIYRLYKLEQLIPGQIYIIEDFQTIYQSNIKNDNGKYITYGKEINPSNKYNIIIIASTNNTIFRNVIIIGHEDWDVKYDINQQILDDGEKTMGRIVFLSDQNGNSACYDFKNIKIDTEQGLKYTFDKNGIDNSKNCSNNDITNCNNIIFCDDCHNNIIKGNNIVIKNKLCNFVGKLENSQFNMDFSDSTLKSSVYFNNKYYIDYLDLETLTHQFYATDNINIYFS